MARPNQLVDRTVDWVGHGLVYIGSALRCFGSGVHDDVKLID
jgi:hypothetical protein